MGIYLSFSVQEMVLPPLHEFPHQEPLTLLRFNLVRVEIRELRPKVLAESDEVLVHYRSRTNVWRGLSTKTLA